MLRVAGSEDEFEEEHNLEVRLIDPERTETNVLAVDFRVPEMPPFKQPGMEAGFLLPAGITSEAGAFGLYTLEIYLDGRRHRSVAIAIRPASDLQQHA
jgi:hypothetical protein